MKLEDMVISIFNDIDDEVNATTKWKSTSKYVRIRHLQIDKRGSFGERLV